MEASSDGDTLLVTPPTWRPDLTMPADLVEEAVNGVGRTSRWSCRWPRPAAV